jgi:hypothetical protein
MSAELTTTDVAERLGRPERTVRLWCKQGLFLGARSVSTPRGDYWVIPESALKDFKEPKMGRRPSKTADEGNGPSKADRDALKRKALARWEGEGGAPSPAKKSAKKGGKQ